MSNQGRRIAPICVAVIVILFTTVQSAGATSPYNSYLYNNAGCQGDGYHNHSAQADTENKTPGVCSEVAVKLKNNCLQSTTWQYSTTKAFATQTVSGCSFYASYHMIKKTGGSWSATYQHTG